MSWSLRRENRRPASKTSPSSSRRVSSSSFTIYWFTFIFMYFLIILCLICFVYIWFMFIYFILSPEIVRNYLKCNNVLLHNKLFMIKKDVKHQTGFEPKFYPCHQNYQSCLLKKEKSPQNHILVFVQQLMWLICIDM